MRTFKLLILVSTVTLLGACSGKKKSSPNMRPASQRGEVRKTTQGFQLAGQCGMTGELSKQELCQELENRIAQNDACKSDWLANFKANECGSLVDTKRIDADLSRVTVEENIAVVEPENLESKTESAVESVTDIKVDITNSDIVVLNTGNETQDNAGSTVTMERVASGSTEPVVTSANIDEYLESNSSQRVRDALAIVKAEKQTASDDVAAKTTVIEELNIRYMGDQEPRAQALDIQPEIYEIETVDVAVETDFSGHARIARAKNVAFSRKSRVFAVDKSFSDTEKKESACAQQFEMMCTKDDRSQDEIDKCYKSKVKWKMKECVRSAVIKN